MHLLLVLLFSFSSFATSELSLDSKWLKLLHYKKNLLGNYVSEADSKSFFLDKNGKNDPKAELEAAQKIFSETTLPDDNHPICKFPLRYKWLNSKLGNPWKADFSGCRKYIEFFSKVAARRVSIVFSSYYLTSPNSAFGHTLLRFSRFDDRNETEMLDYGINYAAHAQENNPFLYAVKGLFGGFKGEFAAIPYYYKIREYSNFEFRDLWSYDLKFSMPEVLEMVDHVWELSHTHFDYFYFRENCSYHLLSVLEVARPSLRLTDTYNVYTIPADTIRLLQREGLIEEGKRRESTYSRLTRLSEDLKENDLKKAKSISEKPERTPDLIQGLENHKAASILDVTMEAFDYYHFEKILKDDPATKERKANILFARAKNPVITGDALTNDKLQKDSPAFSHSPTRLTLAENYNNKLGKGTRFEFRAALHDLLDPLRGTLKQSQLELGKLSFEVKESDYRTPKLILDQLSFFNIRNFTSQNFWASPMAWEIDLGIKQLHRLQCFNCPAGYVNGSIGNALELYNERLLMAFLINGEVDFQSQFENNYRVGLGPKFFTRFKFTDKWVAGLNTYYHFNTFEHKKIFQNFEWWNELEARHHFTDRVSLSLKGGGIERQKEWQTFGELGLLYFYE